MFDDLEKKMHHFDQIFKMKESLFTEFKTKSIDNKAICTKIDKLLLEFSCFKSSLIETNYEMYKLALENKLYKNDLEQLKKQRSNEFLFIFNKQNVEIISSILNVKCLLIKGICGNEHEDTVVFQGPHRDLHQRPED